MDDLQRLSAQHEALGAMDVLALAPDDFDRRFASATARAVVEGASGQRSSLAAALAIGLTRVAQSQEQGPPDASGIPGWLLDDPNPWVLVVVGFAGADETVPDDPELVTTLTDDWIEAADANGANDRLRALHDVIDDLVRRDNPNRHALAAATLVRAVEDPLCMEPLPMHLSPAVLLAAGPNRSRPHPTFELPVPHPPSGTLRRMVTGRAQWPAGTLGARLISGFSTAAALGSPIRSHHPAVLTTVALALGYHPDGFADVDEASAWSWATPHGTSASTVVDIVASLSEHDSVLDVLRYAATSNLLDEHDDAERLPADLHHPPTHPYGRRSRVVPTTSGRSVVLDDPDQADEVAAALSRRRDDFRRKFGRDPQPGDPVFFDPDADEPIPIHEDSFTEELVGKIAKTVGIDAAYAAARTGGLILTEDNRHLISSFDQDRWLEGRGGMAEVVELLGDGDKHAALLVAVELAVDDLVAGELHGIAYLHDHAVANACQELSAGAVEGVIDEATLVGDRSPAWDAPGMAADWVRRHTSTVPERCRAQVASALDGQDWVTVRDSVAGLSDGLARWWAMVLLVASASAPDG